MSLLQGGNTTKCCGPSTTVPLEDPFWAVALGSAQVGVVTRAREGGAPLFMYVCECLFAFVFGGCLGGGRVRERISSRTVHEQFVYPLITCTHPLVGGSWCGPVGAVEIAVQTSSFLGVTPLRPHSAAEGRSSSHSHTRPG